MIGGETTPRMLVDFDRPAMAIYEALLHRGYISRPVANYGLPNCLRVTTGTDEQNEGFVRVLGEVMAEGAA